MNKIETMQNELESERISLEARKYALDNELKNLKKISESITDLSESGIISEDPSEMDIEIIYNVMTMRTTITALQSLIEKYGEENRSYIEVLIESVELYC